MVAGPLNRPIRVDEVCMTLSFGSPFALASLKRFCGAPAERCPTGTPRSLLTGSSARFFPKNTAPFLVLLGVYLAPSETLPEDLLGRVSADSRISATTLAVRSNLHNGPDDHR